MGTIFAIRCVNSIHYSYFEWVFLGFFAKVAPKQCKSVPFIRLVFASKILKNAPMRASSGGTWTPYSLLPIENIGFAGYKNYSWRRRAV